MYFETRYKRSPINAFVCQYSKQFCEINISNFLCDYLLVEVLSDKRHYLWAIELSPNDWRVSKSISCQPQEFRAINGLSSTAIRSVIHGLPQKSKGNTGLQFIGDSQSDPRLPHSLRAKIEDKSNGESRLYSPVSPILCSCLQRGRKRLSSSEYEIWGTTLLLAPISLLVRKRSFFWYFSTGQRSGNIEKFTW